MKRVMHLGASGFIPKAFSGEALLAAVREVLAGNIFQPGNQAGARLDDATPVPPVSRAGVRPDEIGLTDRQAQVLALMVRGMSNRDIADQLGLSEGTVKIHATAVFKTLGVNSRTQALVAVARYGVDFESVF
jgi:DNA-binding NarL/FixJ family response regulator